MHNANSNGIDNMKLVLKSFYEFCAIRQIIKVDKVALWMHYHEINKLEIYMKRQIVHSRQEKLA